MKLRYTPFILILACSASAQMSMNDVHRGTFQRQGTAQYSGGRTANTIDGMGRQQIRYVPVVIDGQVVYVPENKVLVVPSAQPPAYDQITIQSPAGSNTRVTRSFTDDASPKIKNWPRTALGFDKVQKPLTGSGVVVALFDSGVSPHEQFAAGSVDVLDVTGQDNPSDMYGHGTAVAGIIVGSGAGESGFNSVAPGVKLKSYKISDDKGGTNNLFIEQAVNRVFEYNKYHSGNPITIINISYGLDDNNDLLKAALKRAYDSGITIIASAGNNAEPVIVYPAAYDFVIAVGAINHRMKLLGSSNFGPGLDFTAPGAGIYSPDNEGGYGWVRGTSFASAYITGIAALITEAYQNKYGKKPSPQEVYAILKKISTRIADLPGDKQGNGLPDASKISEAV